MFVIAIAKVRHFFHPCKFFGNKFKNYSKKLQSLACACTISPHPHHVPVEYQLCIIFVM